MGRSGEESLIQYISGCAILKIRFGLFCPLHELLSMNTQLRLHVLCFLHWCDKLVYL